MIKGTKKTKMRSDGEKLNKKFFQSFDKNKYKKIDEPVMKGVDEIPIGDEEPVKKFDDWLKSVYQNKQK